MTFSTRACAGLAALALFPATTIAQAETEKLETVIVTGVRTQKDVPNKIEEVTAETARTQINVINTEDMLKYMPSITVRKRHYGDTQDPLATRTSGVGASARSLLFVDGILISSPIGNNNTSASPHFGIAAPQDVDNFEILYGPFAAEYGGGSIGAVLNITTRMPDSFELYADALGAVQDFSQYASKQAVGTWQVSGGIGDREGDFSWRLSLNHLDSLSQPLAIVTANRAAAPSVAGTVVTGAFDGANRTGAPIAILGAGGIEAQMQDTGTIKLAYDLSNGMQASYTASIFHQTDHAGVETYLRDGAGAPVFAGSINSSGYNYVIPASSFSNNIYGLEQTDLAQAVTLKSASDGNFAWEMVVSSYQYLGNKQRVPVTALPAAFAGGAGSTTRLNGTGWYTLDFKGVWRGFTDHDVSFGVHRDAETFAQSKYNTADWRVGQPVSVASTAKGRSATNAFWAQDIWSLTPDVKATLGARVEDWRAYDGSNYSATPALNVNQPRLSTSTVSPKASLAYAPDATWLDGAWSFSASWGVAYRMPTVTELYQAITTGTQLTVPNPNLRPEHANAYELAAERRSDDGRLRVSLFQEDITQALLSQSAPLVTGSPTLYSFVQNVDRTRVRGVEVVAEQNDVLVPGLQLSGSLTYTDAHILRDTAFAAAVRKIVPQLPKLRATAVATYRVDDWSFTLAGRYSDRAFGTIDNSDIVSDTWQGFGRYLVADARVRYQVDPQWSVALGVDNLNNDKHFLFHPFPQRTVVMEIHFRQ